VDGLWQECVGGAGGVDAVSGLPRSNFSGLRSANSTSTAVASALISVVRLSPIPNRRMLCADGVTVFALSGVSAENRRFEGGFMFAPELRVGVSFQR
jgi:hypothetical protein